VSQTWNNPPFSQTLFPCNIVNSTSVNYPVMVYNMYGSWQNRNSQMSLMMTSPGQYILNQLNPYEMYFNSCQPAGSSVSTFQLKQQEYKSEETKANEIHDFLNKKTFKKRLHLRKKNSLVMLSKNDNNVLVKSSEREQKKRQKFAIKERRFSNASNEINITQCLLNSSLDSDVSKENCYNFDCECQHNDTYDDNVEDFIHKDCTESRMPNEDSTFIMKDDESSHVKGKLKKKTPSRHDDLMNCFNPSE